MIFPSIDKLLNIVHSKYELVHVISTRSKEMHDYKSKKDIGKAMEELEKGLIKTKNNYEEK